MSITYPLSLPAASTSAGNPIGPRSITMRAQSIVSVSASPYTGNQQSYEFPGDWWEADITLPPMQRSAAEQWVAFLLALHGRAGTCLVGDITNIALLGSAAGTVLVNGANAAGSHTLSVKGMTGTLKAGDYLMVGSGTTTRMYKNLTDATGNPVSLDIFPSLREALADGAAVTIGASAKGTFRLAANKRDWSVDETRLFGLQFSVIEAF